MLLKYFRFLICGIFTLVVTSCATNPGDIQVSDSIVQKSTWLLISTNSQADYYYDPYSTKRDELGTIETLGWGKNKITNKKLTVNKFFFNCDSKHFKYYKVNSLGGWELSADWAKVPEGSVIMDYINSLCSKTTPDGEIYDFLFLSPSPTNPNYYRSWYLLRGKEFQPSVKNGKTIKVQYLDMESQTWFYNYFYMDCQNKKYADSPKLSLSELNWNGGAHPNSTIGYLFRQYCGVELPITTPKTTSQSFLGKGSSDMEDAKQKCADLGFKKGSEQFGNCVLKLTR